MTFQQVKDEISFVAVGSFNPLIFQPEWFLRHDLLPEVETASAEVELIHPDVTKFKTTWFFIEVVQNRFSIRTENSGRADELRDLVADIFNILCETPVNAVGFNRTIEYSCSDEKSWHAVGNVLVPKEIWHTAFPESSGDTDIGTKNLEVEARRFDGLPGMTRITMYPSSPLPDPAVSFRVNDHIEFQEFNLANPDENLTSLVLGRWDRYMNNAEQAILRVLEEVGNART